jgi:hypothetical protein
MPDNQIVWPMDVSENHFTSGPLIFRPRGFLVAILENADETDRAVVSLRNAGFGQEELRVYTSQQILDDHQRYATRQDTTHRVVRAVTNDPDTVDLYFGHARDGRPALWVHVEDDDAADRAIRHLSDRKALHIRHYGHRKQTDFVMRRPTSSAGDAAAPVPIPKSG